MSFYRNFMVAVAAGALSTVVFAADDVNSNNMQSRQVTVKTAEAAPIATPATNAAQQPNAAVPQQTKVNLNTATIKELMDVKGMSRVKAKNIIAYRKKHGNFKSLDDLKMVKGFKKIKDNNFKAIQDQLIIE